MEANNNKDLFEKNLKELEAVVRELEGGEVIDKKQRNGGNDRTAVRGHG